MLEAGFQELQSRTEDAKEGVASFLERRPSEFRGY
jgi:enoyl-CoA hydratase/carnithine racemase